MLEDIKTVVETISDAGGKMRPSDLVKNLRDNPRERRRMQRALQVALDKGVVELNRDMELVVPSSKQKRAA